jgi:hypothetical protein
MERHDSCRADAGFHSLTAVLPEAGWVMLQLEVQHHENAIPVAVRVLICLDLRG